jgi:hypothetical protein
MVLFLTSLKLCMRRNKHILHASLKYLTVFKVIIHSLHFPLSTG